MKRLQQRSNGEFKMHAEWHEGTRTYSWNLLWRAILAQVLKDSVDRSNEAGSERTEN